MLTVLKENNLKFTEYNRDTFGFYMKAMLDNNVELLKFLLESGLKIPSNIKIIYNIAKKRNQSEIVNLLSEYE